MKEKVPGSGFRFLSFGYQNQCNTAQTKSKDPFIKNGTFQPPAFATTATAGTPTTPDSEAKAIRTPNALVLLASAITSATPAMLLGGVMPPDKPVMTRNPNETPKVGAKADANTLMDYRVSPATATGRLPNESEIGPTEITETAHAANVADTS